MKRRKTRRYKVSTVSPAHGNGNWLMVCARELIHNSVHASLISPRVHIVMLDLPTCHDETQTTAIPHRHVCSYVHEQVHARRGFIYPREECSRTECNVNMHYYRYSSIRCCPLSPPQPQSVQAQLSQTKLRVANPLSSRKIIINPVVLHSSYHLISPSANIPTELHFIKKKISYCIQNCFPQDAFLQFRRKRLNLSFAEKKELISSEKYSGSLKTRDSFYSL